jgi:hypothetical protein
MTREIFVSGIQRIGQLTGDGTQATTQVPDQQRVGVIVYSPSMAAIYPKTPMKRTYNIFALSLAKSLYEPMLDFLRRYITSLLIAVSDSLTGPLKVADVVWPDVGVHL